MADRQSWALLAGVAALSMSSHIAPFTTEPLRFGVRKTAKKGLSGKKRPRKFKGSKAAKRQSRKP